MKSWAFSLEGCLGYPLNKILLPRVAERPPNCAETSKRGEGLKTYCTDWPKKKITNELKASKASVGASRAGPQKTSSMSWGLKTHCRGFNIRGSKNFINEVKASRRIVEASRAGPQKKITSLRVIPTVTSYYTFVTNSDILCAQIWREREGDDNSDEI